MITRFPFSWSSLLYVPARLGAREDEESPQKRALCLAISVAFVLWLCDSVCDVGDRRLSLRREKLDGGGIKGGPGVV
jgi:hypothetical protein